jgi:hypothetical protein
MIGGNIFLVNFSWNWMEKLYNLFFIKKTTKLLQRQDLRCTCFNWDFLYYSLLIGPLLWGYTSRHPQPNLLVIKRQKSMSRMTQQMWTCKRENDDIKYLLFGRVLHSWFVQILFKLFTLRNIDEDPITLLYVFTRANGEFSSFSEGDHSMINYLLIQLMDYLIIVSN